VEDMFADATAWNAKYYRDDGTYHGPPSAWVAYPPPPAPLSETERKQAELEEKKREAEEKRAEARALREDAAEKKAAADAQYGDFVGDVEGLDGVDEDVKRKILMLADALMKNQKVVEMAAPAVSAANEEEAVSIVQDTIGIPDSAAVWTATAVGVRRRGLLQSVSYDVTALLDPDEAANALVLPPPPANPPPPPSPPPRALIWDDEDAASERGRALVHLAVAAIVALAVVARGG